MEPVFLAYLGAGVTVAGLVVAVLRFVHQRERTHEDHAKLREEFDSHIAESDGLIQRFILLEKEAQVFAERLNDLRTELRAARVEANSERVVILGAINELRNQIDSKLEDLRRAVYEGDRRREPRQ